MRTKSINSEKNKKYKNKLLSVKEKKKNKQTQH